MTVVHAQEERRKAVEPDEQESFTELKAWIDRTAIPTSRPDSLQEDEVAGLALLDLALRLDHVSRVTDSLRIMDRSHVRRAVALDIDLRDLTRDQRDALRVRDRSAVSSRSAEGVDAKAHLWVPVSRHSRLDLTPVVVRDAEGKVVPRLTQGAASGALTAGLTRLFKLIRDSEGQRSGASDLPKQSMWLIQRALASLVEFGPVRPDERKTAASGDAQDATDQSPADASSSAPKRADGANAEHDADPDARRRAIDFLDSMDLQRRRPLDRLVEVAYSEYLLVVMLPESTSHAHLHFDAPLIPAHVERRPWLRDALWRRTTPGSRWHRLLQTDEGRESRLRQISPGREYTVRYDTEVVRSLGSYHVTVEVAEEILVRRYIFSSDAEAASVAELGREMRRLAGAIQAARDEAEPANALSEPERRAAEDRRTGIDSMLWIELEEVMSKLFEVGQRRILEYRRYRQYLKLQNLKASRLSGLEVYPTKTEADERAALAALAEGSMSLGLLDALDVIHARRPWKETLEHHHLGPSDFQKALGSIDTWLRKFELGQDVIVENDPRENGAHAQWRHQPLHFGTSSLEPIRARVFLTMADEKPALVDSVRRMLLGIIVVVVGLFWLLRESYGVTGADEEHDVLDLPQADAMVAVLLLVPGILLTRLDIPSTNSVLGQLRILPRLIAYASVVCTSALAVGVATGWVTGADPWRWAVPAFLLLGVCLLLSVLDTIGRAVKKRQPIPRHADVPRWLRLKRRSWWSRPLLDAAASWKALRWYRRRVRKHVPDVVFDAIDGHDRSSAPDNRSSAPDRSRPPDDRSSARVDRTVLGLRLLRGAELARVAAQSVGAARTQTELVIEHELLEPTTATPPTPPTPAQPAGLDPALTIDVADHVEFAAGPFQVSARTRATDAVDALGADGVARRAPSVVQGPSEGAARYTVGTGAGGVTFRVNNHTLEFLVRLPSPDSVMGFLEDVVEAVSEVPKRFRPTPLAPLTVRSVHMPDAHMVGSAGDDRPDAGIPADARTVRLSVAVPVAVKSPPRGGGVRLSLVREVIRVSAARGAALHIAGNGPGAGQAEWRQLLAGPPPQGSETDGPDHADRSDGVRGLLTLVGPASGYEAATMLHLSGLLSAGPARVTDVSVMGLHGRPVLTLGLEAPRPEGIFGASAPVGRELAASLIGDDARRAFAQLVGAEPGDPALAEVLADYVPMLTLVDDARPETASPGARSLFVQWRIRHDGASQIDPLKVTLRHLAVRAVPCRVRYATVRPDGELWLRGRARLTVDVPDGALLDLAKSTQDEVRRRVLTTSRLRPDEFQLAVVRHEWWLTRR